jgi:hypothetical protein
VNSSTSAFFLGAGSSAVVKVDVNDAARASKIANRVVVIPVPRLGLWMACFTRRME